MSYSREEFMNEFEKRLSENEDSTKIWVWSIINNLQASISEHADKAAWGPSEANEVIGEYRERKYVLRFLKEIHNVGTNACCITMCNNITQSIEDGEHH